MTQSPHARALAAATEIAEHLTTPRHTCFDSNDTTGARPLPQSLGGGAAGVALLHIERARTGHGQHATAHAWITEAARGDLSNGANAGLYFGVPSLAFVSHAAAERPGILARARARFDDATTTLTRRRLRAAHGRIDRAQRPALAEFDLIRGLAGLGAYHLHRDPHSDITRAVLCYLVRLTEPLRGDDTGLPGWWTEQAPNGAVSPEFPGGHGNLGMAHGIAAPLTLMSVARRAGVVVEGQDEAIDRVCAWMDTWRGHDRSGPWWPGFVNREHAHRGQAPDTSRQRPSWCYGTPGVARAQQLAGLATRDTDHRRQRLAEHAMLGCLRDPAQLDRLTDTGLCHGLAGLLHTATRMAADATDPALAAELPALVDQLLARLPETPDNPEFLDGHAGIALALHAIGTRTTPQTPWDTSLLLA